MAPAKDDIAALGLKTRKIEKFLWRVGGWFFPSGFWIYRGVH